MSRISRNRKKLEEIRNITMDLLCKVQECILKDLQISYEFYKQYEEEYQQTLSISNNNEHKNHLLLEIKDTKEKINEGLDDLDNIDKVIDLIDYYIGFCL